MCASVRPYICVLIINVLWSRPSAVYSLNIIFNALLSIPKGIDQDRQGKGPTFLEPQLVLWFG